MIKSVDFDKIWCYIYKGKGVGDDEKDKYSETKTGVV